VVGTPTEIRGGNILAHSTDLHQVPLQIAMPQLCAKYKDHHFGSCWSDGEGREDETNVIHSQIYVVMCFPWSHDHGKVEKSQEIAVGALENKVLYI